ncbi:aminoacylase-1-like [Cherax quadricarinatus]
MGSNPIRSLIYFNTFVIVLVEVSMISNIFQGGVQYNVVPAELNVGFDIRVSPTQDLTTFEEKITSLCKAAGEDVTYEFVVNKLPEASERQNQVTCVEDGKNPWWDAFSQACKHQGVNLEKQILCGGTDIRYLRQVSAHTWNIYFAFLLIVALW